MFQGSLPQLALINYVIKDFGLENEEIEISHKREAVRAKWVIYRAFRSLGLSTVRIGYITNKDHSTILSGLKRIQSEPYLLDKVDEVLAWFSASYPDSIKKKLVGWRNTKLENIISVKQLLNEETKDVEVIAQKFKLPKDKITEYIEYIEKNCQRKKIPNYKNGTEREIFV